jgi:hypothetical protein
MTKHKVFTSYYHYDDQWYKNKFIELFGHLFIDKSVEDGDISTDISDEYIKRLIQDDDFLADASVEIVLCGPNTRKRKHVDWEIYGALHKKLDGYSGLVGILLPEFPMSNSNTYNRSDLPERLADNVKTGFAKIYTWQSLNSSFVADIIEDAFIRRTKSELIDNSRSQMKYNLN